MPLFLEGMARTQPAVGAIAISTSPVFIAILAVLLRQDPFRWTLAAGSALSLLGVGIVEFAGGKDVEGTAGALLVLLSAVIWAAGVVVTRPLYDRYKSVTITAWSLAASFLPVQIYGLESMIRTSWLEVGGASWAAFVYFWLAAGIAGFAIYFSVISEIGAARAGLMQYMIPAVAAAMGWLLLGQPLSPIRITGIGIVLLGVWIGVRRPGPSPVARRDPPDRG
jgi:drug/metabolite transporter (DMT)-like permease